MRHAERQKTHVRYPDVRAHVDRGLAVHVVEDGADAGDETAAGAGEEQQRSPTQPVYERSRQEVGDGKDAAEEDDGHRRPEEAVVWWQSGGRVGQQGADAAESLEGGDHHHYHGSASVTRSSQQIVELPFVFHIFLDAVLHLFQLFLGHGGNVPVSTRRAGVPQPVQRHTRVGVSLPHQ